ncbi:MAG TPA: toast rack family protein [Longimicrobiaceae bacterium]|nr:toast rack family protein [Longimicrobiaceae bacterium]
MRSIRLIATSTILFAAVATVAPAAAQSWQTVNSSRQRWDETQLDVSIEYGAGELTIVAADDPLLYEMEMRYDEDEFTPIAKYDPDAETLVLGLDDRNNGSTQIHGDESRAEIALTREIPVDLDLDFGAGEADVDLGGISLRSLDFSTGASETTVRFSEPNAIRAEMLSLEAGAAEFTVVGLGNARAEHIDFQGGVGSTTLDFSGEWAADASANVQMGIGSLVLRFPRDLGIRLEKDSFLTSFDGDGLVKRGGAYYSTNWDSAEHQLSITVDAAFGSIDVEWIQ